MKGKNTTRALEMEMMYREGTSLFLHHAPLCWIISLLTGLGFSTNENTDLTVGAIL
jgi:hypothetical protein